MSRGRKGGSHLVGRVGERVVALELPLVRQVLPMLTVDPCPGGPAALLGFANLGGAPVAVLAVRALFGLPAPDPLEAVDHRLVVCARGGHDVALLVDDVAGLATPSALRSPAVEDRIVAVDVVRQVGVLDGRLCLVLDPGVAIDWLTRTLDLPSPEPAGSAS